MFLWFRMSFYVLTPYVTYFIFSLIFSVGTGMHPKDVMFGGMVDNQVLPSMPMISRTTNIGVAAPRNHDRAHYQHAANYNAQLQQQQQQQQHPNMQMSGPPHQNSLMKRKATAPTNTEVKMSRPSSSLREAQALILSATSIIDRHLKTTELDKSKVQLEKELQRYKAVLTPEDLECGATFAECVARIRLLEQNLEGYRAREEVIQKQVNDFRIQLSEKENELVNLKQKYQFESLQGYIHKPAALYPHPLVHGMPSASQIPVQNQSMPFNENKDV